MTKRPWRLGDHGQHATRRRRPDDGLRPLIREHLPSVFWTTVETGLASPGVPDLYGARSGRTFWVECKATDGWAVTLEPEQVGWHLAHARAGGCSYVAVRRRSQAGPRKGPACDQLWLLRGAEAPLWRDHGLRGVDEVCPLGCWGGGPSEWDWEAVGDLLLTDCEARVMERALPRGG